MEEGRASLVCQSFNDSHLSVYSSCGCGLCGQRHGSLRSLIEQRRR